MRLDKLVERTRKYNDNPLVPGLNIQDYNNLWPIPQTQIDLNTIVKMKNETESWLLKQFVFEYDIIMFAIKEKNNNFGFDHLINAKIN